MDITRGHLTNWKSFSINSKLMNELILGPFIKDVMID